MIITMSPSYFATDAISGIRPGDLFYFREVGRLVLAVALEMGDPNKRCWMYLSGPNAFKFGEIPATNGRTIAVVPVTAEQLRLRVDSSSSVVDVGEHAPGRLAIGRDDKSFRILGAWPEEDEANWSHYRNAAKTSDWKYVTGDQPAFVFDRWSLSYVDEAGQWVDLVTREPPLGESSAPNE